MAWCFPICYFFVFCSGPLWVLLNLFLCCLSIRIFCYDLFVPIFCSKVVLSPCHLVIGIFSLILLLLADRIFFHFFFDFLVLSVLSFLDTFLVFLHSLEPSDLSPRVTLFVSVVELLFSFHHNIFPRIFLVLGFLLVVVDFEFVFPAYFTIQVLSFCSCYLGNTDLILN